MPIFKALRYRYSGFVLLLLSLFFSGCRSLPTRNPNLEAHLPPPHRIPNEEVKTTMPPHVIEPPDVIQIDAVTLIPKIPYLLEGGDIVFVLVPELTEPLDPINNDYAIAAEGTVNLGLSYPEVKIAGLTVKEAEQAIYDELSKEFRISRDQVSVSLVSATELQPINGPHLVAPDGTINLGTYGTVNITGRTLEEAKAVIEKHLEEYLEKPEVIVDVASYNSKFYYIIVDGAGTGDQIIRQTFTGNETVLDAISALGGLGGTSTKDIWIARPVPDDSKYMQRLPVRWNDIVRDGLTSTNYQIFPGDRLYIRGSTLIRIDATVGLITQPISRISGAILLPIGTIRSLGQSFRRGNEGGGSGLGGGF